MADNDDHGGPPPGWPDKSEIYAEAANMVAMVADRRAMSEILDALRSEQESERQQGERDLRARLERAVQLESGPDAIVEVSGGTDYPVRLARMLQAQERFSAAFGLVVFKVR